MFKGNASAKLGNEIEGKNYGEPNFACNFCLINTTPQLVASNRLAQGLFASFSCDVVQGTRVLFQQRKPSNNPKTRTDALSNSSACSRMLSQILPHTIYSLTEIATRDCYVH